MNPRELLQSAQAAEREGDLARAGALLEQAARIYESTGHAARAAQMRRHVDRLGSVARGGAGEVEEPPGGRGNGGASDADSLPGLDRELVERTPTLADPALGAWCRALKIRTIDVSSRGFPGRSKPTGSMPG